MLDPGVILGDFEICRFLNRGGMGDVYEARQCSLNRLVALKTLPPLVSLDSEALARFQREASIAAQLDHPNIIPVYAFGVAGLNAYFAMKLVRGMTLARFIQHCHPILDVDQGHTAVMPARHDDETETPGTNIEIHVAPLATELSPRLKSLVEEFRNNPERVATRLGRQLASALDYAHRLGHLHRDIKPSNIMIDEEGQVYLIDFGLTRTMVAHSTEHRSGTPRYMSPEQYDLERLDGRTDVYSLAVTLYELLTGRPAFKASDSGGLGRMIRTGEVQPLSVVLPDLSPQLSRCIEQAMSPDRGKRFSTAAEFGTALADAGRPVSSTARRPRFAAASLAGLLLCITALLGWSSRAWTVSPRLDPPLAATKVEWEAGESVDVLKELPVRLVGTESGWQSHEESGSVSFYAPRELSTFALGDAPGSSFELEVDLEDVVPTDRFEAFAGVFWQWQQEEQRPEFTACESLQLERMHSEADFKVSWRRPIVRDSYSPIASGRLFTPGDFQPGGPHRLRVRVIDGRLDRAEWNDQHLAEMNFDAVESYAPLRPIGPVGVIVYRARARISRFHVTALNRSE